MENEKDATNQDAWRPMYRLGAVAGIAAFFVTILQILANFMPLPLAALLTMGVVACLVWGYANILQAKYETEKNRSLARLFATNDAILSLIHKSLSKSNPDVVRGSIFALRKASQKYSAGDVRKLAFDEVLQELESHESDEK